MIIIIRNLLTMSILLLSVFSEAYPNKKQIRKPANSSFQYESVILEYAGGSGLIKNLRFHMGPFTKYIALKFPRLKHLKTLDGDSKVVILDCSQDESSSFLRCVSGCDGGAITIEFNESVRLDSLTVKKFNDFRPLACDGSETGNEPTVSLKKDKTLVLKRLKLER